MRIDRQGDKLVRVPDDQLQEKSHFPFVFEALSLPDGEVYVSEFGINHEDAAQEAAVPVFNMASPVVQGGSCGAWWWCGWRRRRSCTTSTPRCPPPTGFI